MAAEPSLRWQWGICRGPFAANLEAHSPTDRRRETARRRAPSHPSHWVGDGFPVRSIFDYNNLGKEALSPFLLMDYAGPVEFSRRRSRAGWGSTRTGA